MNLGTDLDHTALQVTAEAAVLAAQFHRLVEANSGDIGFVDLDAGLHSLAGSKIENSFSTGFFAFPCVYLKHQAIQGSKQFTSVEISFQTASTRPGLVQATLKANQFILLFLKEHQRCGSPLGSFAVSGHFQFLHGDLLHQAGYFRIQFIQISLQACTVVETSQHLPTGHHLSFVHQQVRDTRG